MRDADTGAGDAAHAARPSMRQEAGGGERRVPAFALRGATVRFGAVTALRDVDLTVAAQRTTVLLGPSGCGKSTVLRVCAGVVPVAAGDVLVEGAPLAGADLRAVRRRLGFVVQDSGLFPHLTARRNATLPAEIAGWDAPRIATRVGELAALVRLEESMLARYPAQLSGGQRQRVSLMRALMLGPDALLLDEPLGALDPLSRSALQDDLRALVRTLQVTVVLVTHDLAEAAWFADDVVLMREGVIAQQGSFADIAERPASPFARQFVEAQRRLHATAPGGDA